MNFYTFESVDSNNNIHEIIKLLEFLTEKEDVQWIISDLDIVPQYRGDYSPSEKIENRPQVYLFELEIKNNFFISLNFSKLRKLLEEASCIRRGVFICLQEQTELTEFYATVEPKEPHAIQHKFGLHEVRILDDLIFILSDSDISYLEL
ncbi:hypothetical protein [Paenibacillus sp. FJAT-26967]|uniref:hypothetical protein n=1 Tax=Paenibacillus sp. FJAT-26967 TaxID=1729690 RepID=UPI0008385881|nr:hypothetical protein [Paenibacillus sp. FJAT-26967]